MATSNKLLDVVSAIPKLDLLKIISNISQRKGYKVFRYNKNNPINLNIWGVRAADLTPDIYNDLMMVFYETPSGDWLFKFYSITTDPGKYYLLNSINKSGTAILKEGQYIGMWKVGYHQGKKDHKALIQVGNCDVYRDANRNGQLDFDGKVETGLFGINCHRNNRGAIGMAIGKWSAGCQVHQNSAKFENDFINFVEKALNGSRVSYTLINEFDLKL